MRRRLPDGRWVVPGNRWDLVPEDPRPADAVSVVIPYFRQKAQLDRLLEALTLQTHPATQLQVVVADDGSPEPPAVEAYRRVLDLTVVRQPDRGFRAAAARNLGASVADGTVVCFLDADTLPEPDYVAVASRLPGALPDAVTVGRRRHADLAGFSASDVREWLSGNGIGPTELTEPAWLRHAYADSRNLLDSDHRSYRFIISAVMTCARSLFDEVGRFDESFTAYGGEDWEFAHRAFDAGAVFAHEPGAVAWHDGPDWAERSSTQGSSAQQTAADRTAKNREALALAPLITDPAARSHGIVHAIPQVTAIIHTDGHSSASLLVTVGSLVSSGDCQVWIDGPDAHELRAVWGDTDSRIHTGVPTAAHRSRVVLELHAPMRLGAQSLSRLIATVDTTGVGRMEIGSDRGRGLTLTTSRSRARAHRWATALDTHPTDLSDELFGVSSHHVRDFDIDHVETHPHLAW